MNLSESEKWKDNNYFHKSGESKGIGVTLKFCFKKLVISDMFCDPNISSFFLEHQVSDCGLALYVVDKIKMEEDPVVTITPYCCLSDDRCLNLSRQPVMQEEYSLPYLIKCLCCVHFIFS